MLWNGAVWLLSLQTTFVLDSARLVLPLARSPIPRQGLLFYGLANGFDGVEYLWGCFTFDCIAVQGS